MAMRQPWEDDPIMGGQSAQSAAPIVQITPPNRQPPLARPDQARGEGAQAGLSEYELRTRPGREARQDQRAEQGQDFTQRQQVLNAWRTDPQVRAFQDARTSYYALRNLQANPNGVNAVATIFAFMKALDPGSTVREGEQASAQNTGGVPTAITNAYNHALSGNGLSDDQRRQMVLAAGDQLNARARAYNESTARFREQLRGAGANYDELLNQLPFAGSPGARGYDLENETRRRFGLQPVRPRDPGAVARGEGATVNAYNPQTGEWRYGIPEGNLPPGYEVQFGMDELEPSRMIANATGTPPDARSDLQFTDADLAAIESWLRAQGPNATPEGLNAFIAQLPPNPNWQGPHSIGNADEIVRNFRERGTMFEGQAPIRPPDISDARGQGGLGEGVDVVGRGAADTASFGTADELSAGLDTLFRGGSYRDNLRRQRAIDEYDAENHPYLRIGGQLAGAVALPSGAREAGQQAARAALRQGLGRAEAVQLARGAMGRRLAMEGGAYSGAYGVGSGEGDLLDRAAHGVVDAAIGALTGRVLPEVTPARVSGVPREAAAPELPPLVDPETGNLNQPLEAATPAQRVGAARAFDVDLPLGSATDRGGRIIAGGLENYPFSAGVMSDEKGIVSDQIRRAVEAVASRYGSARGLNEGGASLQDSANAWIRRAQQGTRANPERGVITQAYDAIPIPPETPAITPNTLGRLRDLTQRFSSNPILAEELRDPVFQRYLTAIEQGGISWEDLKAFRTRVGNRRGRAQFNDGPDEADLDGLYSALSEDMRATAESISPRALRSFERANNLNREVETRIQDGLTRILGNDGMRNPEAAARRVQEIITSNKAGSDLNLVSQIRSSTVKGGGWNDIAGTVIRLMGQPANSEGRAFDPSVFVKSYADMSEPARNLLFGSLRNSRGETNALRSALDDFVAVNQRLSSRDTLRNTSPTGPILTGVGTVTALGTDITHLAIPGATAFGLAKLWTNPGFVRWATGYNRMIAGAERAGQPLTEENLAKQRNYLIRVARSSPAIAAEIGDIADRLFPQPVQLETNREQPRSQRRPQAAAPR